MDAAGARHEGAEDAHEGAHEGAEGRLGRPRPLLRPLMHPPAPASSAARRAALARLKDRIGRLAPVPRAAAEPGRPPLALIPGGVLELRIEDWRHRPAAAAFALALAGKAAAAGAGGAGPIVLIARREEAREGGLPFARGLARFGVDPARALLALARDEKELLWAAEEAARTKGLGAVLVETGGEAHRLDLTAGRRLVLAAEGSGAALVLIRRNISPPPSAAAARFLLAPAPSAGDPDDDRAPGAPRWRILVERFRPDAAAAARGAFLAEWRHDRKDFETVAAGPAVPLPLSAPLADGALLEAPSGGLRRGA